MIVQLLSCLVLIGSLALLPSVTSEIYSLWIAKNDGAITPRLHQTTLIGHFAADLVEEFYLNPALAFPHRKFPDLVLNLNNQAYTVKLSTDLENSPRRYFMDITSSNYDHTMEIQRLDDPRNLGRAFVQNSSTIIPSLLDDLFTKSLSISDKTSHPLDLIPFLQNQEKILRHLDLMAPYKPIPEQMLTQAAVVISETKKALKTEYFEDPKLIKVLARWYFHICQLLLGIEIRYKDFEPSAILSFLHGSQLFPSLIFEGIELMDMDTAGANLEIPILIEGIDRKRLEKQISIILLDRSEEYLKIASNDKTLGNLRVLLQGIIRNQKKLLGLHSPHRTFQSTSSNTLNAWSSSIESPEAQLESIQNSVHKFYPRYPTSYLPFSAKHQLSFNDKLIFMSAPGELAIISDENGLEVSSELKKYFSNTIGLEKFTNPMYGYETLRAWGLMAGQIVNLESSNGYQWTNSSVPIPLSTMTPNQEIRILNRANQSWYILSENGKAKEVWHSVGMGEAEKFEVVQSLKSDFFVSYKEALFALEDCNKTSNCKPKWNLIAGTENFKLPEIPSTLNPHAILVRDSEVFISDKLTSKIYYSDGVRPFTLFSGLIGDPLSKLILHQKSLITLDRLGRIWILSENPSLDFLSRPLRF